MSSITIIEVFFLIKNLAREFSLALAGRGSPYENVIDFFSEGAVPPVAEPLGVYGVADPFAESDGLVATDWIDVDFHSS